MADPPGATALGEVVLTRWFGWPELEATGLRWARPANHMQHGVARVGLFYMTGDRLGFQPKRIDRLFGARGVYWDLSTLTDIQLRPTLRKLRVTLTTDTGRQRFLVADGSVVYDDLRSLPSPPDGGAP